jgi:hypothetical protein
MQRLASNELNTPPCNVQFRLFTPQLMLRRPTVLLLNRRCQPQRFRINDDAVPRRHELGAPNRLEDLDGPPLTTFG